MNNFHYVSVILDSMYGVELEDEDVEEIGLLAWGLIGNRNTKLYRYSTFINPKDNSVTLPCNAIDANGDSLVELVTSSYEDWSRVTNKHDFGDYDTSYVEHAIESEKFYQSPYYLPGKVLKYEQVGEKLYFTHNYGKVNILYKGIIMDEEGLPQLSDKEAIAIATYIAYITKFKEGMITNNKDTVQIANTLKQQWAQQCDQARTRPLSQNDIDAVGDVIASWDRKRYGVGYKIIK